MSSRGDKKRIETTRSDKSEESKIRMIKLSTQTPTFINFDLPTILPKIKIGYTMERVEDFILNPLQCYKCHKYGHHKEKCNGRSVCVEREPDCSTDECKKTHRFANWWKPPGVCCKNLQKRERDPVCKIYQKYIFPRDTEGS